jgi:hypothetical protein
MNKRERHDEYMARKSAEENAASNKQVGGNHYKDCVIQPIDFILANNFGFCEGNIIKYTTRYRKKGQTIQDLEKVIHYAQLLIEKEKGKLNVRE